MLRKRNVKGRLATSLFFNEKVSERGTSQPQKHLREDIINLTFATDTPAKSASTIQDALPVNTSKKDGNKIAERLAFPLNLLQDKKKQELSHVNYSLKDVMMEK